MAKTIELPKTFEADSFSLVPKGRMVLLYASVDGEDVHVASFFHPEKAEWVAEALTDYWDIPNTTKKSKKAAKKK